MWQRLEFNNEVVPNIQISEVENGFAKLKNIVLDEYGSLVPIGYQRLISNAITGLPSLYDEPIRKVRRCNINGVDYIFLLTDTGVHLINAIDPSLRRKPISVAASEVDLIEIPMTIQTYLFITTDTASPNKRLLRYNSAAYPVPTFEAVDLYPTAPSVPTVVSNIVADNNAVLCKYVVTYYNSNIDVETLPSDAVSAYVLKDITKANLQTQTRVYGMSAAQTGYDKIRIYRWTEVVGQYYLVHEGNYIDKWVWVDNVPIDYIGERLLLVPVPLNVSVKGGVYFNDRLYLYDDYRVYISRAYQPLSFTNSVVTSDPLDGFVINIPEKIIVASKTKIGVIVFTASGAYHIAESEGFFYAIPLPLPSPINRYAVYRFFDALAILSNEGLYIYDGNSVDALPFDVRMLFNDEIGRRGYRRIDQIGWRHQRKGNDVYLDISFPIDAYQSDMTNIWTERWVEFLRINLNRKTISGWHTNGFVVWG